ncbi:MAG: GNAT family N-acetyltransferase [Planctomycetota bacterium]|nr:GNAT family N-acetyltransferase [Planctomycetota bacterium]
MSDLLLRPMEPADWPRVAALIHGGTNAWYQSHGMAQIFGCEPRDVELFCRVYEDLDPGCCVLAESDGQLLGSCFYHPRPSHVALGIMNVDANAFGRGVAGRLLGYVIEQAEQRNLPVRLVSSALNLDSYSLYNRAGFVPYGIYQDMTLKVPETGFPHRPEGADRVRDGRPADAAAMSALERELSGIDREKDFRYFLENREGIWRVSVLEADAGALSGFLVSVRHAASHMLGPGAMRDQASAIALLASELDQHRGGSPVWLVPADQQQLVRQCYAWGARNCELHFAQVLGEVRRPTGVAMPTFMPETG